MSKYSTKAYVIGEESDNPDQPLYGIVIYHNGVRVYKCTTLTDNISVARRFAQLINETNSHKV